MQPNGCISLTKTQITWENDWPISRRSLLEHNSILQVKRARPEVDNPVMTFKDFGSEQPRDGLRTPKKIAMNQSLQIDHANVLTDYVDRANAEPFDARDLDTALLQVDGRRTKRRFMKRHVKAAHKPAVQKSGKGAGVDHQ